MTSSLDQCAPAKPEEKKVHLDLGPRSYDILIGSGLLDNAASTIAQIAPKAKATLITDETVGAHYAGKLQSQLQSEGRSNGVITVPAGEQSKSYQTLETVCEQLISLGVERGDIIIALGGGVIGDLAGFAASILRRGVKFVQIPTTLLAQVDSSVGGKTGINSPQGKNLIGAFHQPSLVLADTSTLTSLSQRDFRSGYAEVVKYGLIQDAEFFAWLEENGAYIFERDGDERSYAIEKSCRAKSAVVAADELESGQRALLNLGHTFGHALEAWAGYTGRLLHGEAVAIGMVLAFQFSEQLGLCPAGRAERISAHLRAVKLPTQISDIAAPDPARDGTSAEQSPNADTLWTLMAQDKKVERGVPALILAHDIGQSFVTRDISVNQIQDFLTKSCS